MLIFIHSLSSLLSVIGAYFLLKTVFSLLSKSKNIFLSIPLSNREDLDVLDLSLQSAKAEPISAKAVAVLLEKSFYQGLSEADKQQLQETADFFGAKIYFISEKN